MARIAHHQRQYVAMVKRNVLLTAHQEEALVAEAQRAKVPVSQIVREAVWSWMVGRLSVANESAFGVAEKT